jgi:hypothetical protein
MYVKRVSLKGIKAFKNLDFTFARPDGSYAGWTVITGENASGKTALLKAIAMALVGPDTIRTLQPSLKGWINHNSKSAEISVEVVPGDVDQFTTGRRYETSFWSELTLTKNEDGDVFLKPGDAKRGKKKGPLNGPWAQSTKGWFAAGYGPFRRLYGASPEAQRIMSGPGRVARFATMFKEDATLAECELWLRDLSYKKLEGRTEETKVLNQTLRLMNDDFLRNGIEIDRVDSDGVWLKKRDGQLIPLEDMSEGYRAAVAMMLDILKQLVDVYGSDNLLIQTSEGIAINHHGVVLIDEIDAHLHPAWQRQIGFWLKRRFPNIQFLVTTHSALVCQAADPRGIFHLTAPDDTRPPFQLTEVDYWAVLRGKPDEILLTPAFGLKHTRSERAVSARRKWAELEAKARQTKLTGTEENLKLQLELFIEKNAGSPEVS